MRRAMWATPTRRLSHRLRYCGRPAFTRQSPASQVGAELLFDIISTAYEKTSVIVTTNLPFERWTEVLGSERLVGATLDRLTHRCHLLEATGESYRLREARRRRDSSEPNGRKRKARTATQSPAS